jgi:hypothetical protein
MYNKLVKAENIIIFTKADVHESRDGARGRRAGAMAPSMLFFSLKKPI